MMWSMRCWYTRWQLSSALERGDLASRLGRGHAAGCPSCQAFGHALGSLHERLSRGARAAPVPVIAAPRPRWPLLIAAPAAAAAIVIAVVVSPGGGPAPRGIDEPSLSLSLSLPVSASLSRVHQVADSVSQVLATTPLDAELDALVHDGRRGLDVLLATGGLR